MNFRTMLNYCLLIPRPVGARTPYSPTGHAAEPVFQYEVVFHWAAQLQTAMCQDLITPMSTLMSESVLLCMPWGAKMYELHTLTPGHE